MITTGAKLWFGIATLAFFGAWVFAFGSDWEWFGTFVLGSVCVAASLLGMTAIAIRDGDVAATTDPAAAEIPVRRSLPAYWPPLAAFGGGTALIGLAAHSAVFYAGLGVIALVFLEWLVQGWAERATGDHEHNRRLRNTVMFPLEIPIVASLGAAFIVLTFSRVLLALSKDGSVVAAVVLAVLVLAIGTLVALRPALTSSLVAALIAVIAVVMLGGGIAGLVHGTRHIEPHHLEHESGSGAVTTTNSAHQTENTEQEQNP